MAAVVLPGWELFFEEIEGFLYSLDLQAGVASEDFGIYAVERLEVCIVNVARLVALLETPVTEVAEPMSQVEFTIIRDYRSQLSQLLQCLRMISLEWQQYVEDVELRALQSSYRVGHDQSMPASVGRPRFDIGRDQLEYLSSMGFSWTQVASLLGVSRMTIYRRRIEFGLDIGITTNITDQDLGIILRQMRRETPALGERMVIGRLRSMGIKARRATIRNLIRASDPIQTALRWKGQLAHRRPYSVPGPNSLWHTDGHHKLVRWRFVTHGAIDGYSRLVVFLKCSNNNRAGTTYSLFLTAIRQYGLPSRVRCDQGRENVQIVQHMLHHRGIERRSALVGSSVHNQRIERLWRDLHRCTTKLFYRLFYYLEYNYLLDPLNDTHLFALHYVFLPRINKALEDFKNAWNHHGIRTERGMTPNQLFTSGMLRLRHSGLTAMDFFDVIDDNYGIEEEGLVLDTDEGIEIPRNTLELTEQQMVDLQTTVDPTADCEDYGINMYIDTVQFLNTL